MRTTEFTLGTPADGDYNSQTTTLDQIMAPPDSIEGKILKIMQDWQQEQAGGPKIEKRIELGNGNEIRLEKVEKFAEWKQIADNPCKIISFNILAIFGEVKMGTFCPVRRYKLGNSRDPLIGTEIPIS